jgi:sporulation protein YlmC with PRC-barrel domain
MIIFLTIFTRAQGLLAKGTLRCGSEFQGLKEKDWNEKPIYACRDRSGHYSSVCRSMSSLPPDSWTVTNYYKQDVYDKGRNTVGKIDDVLIDKSGKITALIVGVGGFLGVGEKDVALPFTAVHSEKKDNKWYLTVDETKDSLKNAAGYKYD